MRFDPEGAAHFLATDLGFSFKPNLGRWLKQKHGLPVMAGRLGLENLYFAPNSRIVMEQGG